MKREERIEPGGPCRNAPYRTGTERILFIDDDPTLTHLACDLLGSLGYEVVAKTSSVDALELFRADPAGFDLVITDMTMPCMSGDRLAQEILRIRPGIPIILCTGYSGFISREKAKNIGIREFIMKPFKMKEIADAIRSVLNRE